MIKNTAYMHYLSILIIALIIGENICSVILNNLFIV